MTRIGKLAIYAPKNTNDLGAFDYILWSMVLNEKQSGGSWVFTCFIRYKNGRTETSENWIDSDQIIQETDSVIYWSCDVG